MPDSSTPAITCRQVVKVFGGSVALKSADLDITAGEIHALVGENGAGKSTMLGLVSGRLAADEGDVEVFGHRLSGGSPRDSRDLGLVAVYQELTMVPALSAEANVFLGQTPTRRGRMDRGRMRTRFLQMCDDLDVDIAPDTLARDLSVSQQQMLEIMRGVESQARVILLDEPTAALAEHERETLYRLLRKLNAQGTTIVFVSHNLAEVLDLSDTITVLRDGSVVESAPRDQWDRKRLIEAMVGRSVEVIAERGTHDLGEEVLSLQDVNLPGVLADISLTARAGEIVGLWGLVGSGRTSFMRSVAGAEPRSTGTIVVDGVARRWPRSIHEAVADGVVMVPESRKKALVLGMTGSDNFWLGRRSRRSPFVRRGQEHDEAGSYATRFAFGKERLSEPVRNLSGGNQQKVLLAKWSGHQPRALLIDEPTRGIDVGAKTEVLSSLVTLASEGAAIVVTSSELEEVLAVAHRLLVFAHGRVVREIACDDTEYNVDDIVRHGFSLGAEDDPAD